MSINCPCHSQRCQAPATERADTSTLTGESECKSPLRHPLVGRLELSLPPLEHSFYYLQSNNAQTFSSSSRIIATVVTFHLEFYFPFLIIFYYIVFIDLSSHSTIMLQSQAKYSNLDFSGASIYTLMREKRCRMVYIVNMLLFKKGETIRNHLCLAAVA